MNKPHCLVTTLFIATSLFLFNTNLNAQSVNNANTAVTVSLKQAVDSDCDGILDEPSFAVPGTCIIYTVTATNTGESTIYGLTISGKIPKYTRLYKSMELEHNMLERVSTRLDMREQTIKSQLERLEPGREQAVVMRYAVQIL